MHRRGAPESVCKHRSSPILLKTVNCLVLPAQFSTNRLRRLRRSRLKNEERELGQTILKFLRSNVSRALCAQMSRHTSILGSFQSPLSEKSAIEHRNVMKKVMVKHNPTQITSARKLTREKLCGCCMYRVFGYETGLFLQFADF